MVIYVWTVTFDFTRTTGKPMILTAVVTSASNENVCNAILKIMLPYCENKN